MTPLRRRLVLPVLLGYQRSKPIQRAHDRADHVGSHLRVERGRLSPLTVDIHSLAGLAPLLGDELTSKSITSVELVGVESVGDGEETAYNLKLSNAHVTRFTDASGSAFRSLRRRTAVTAPGR
jgi:hypothetical protein